MAYPPIKGYLIAMHACMIVGDVAFHIILADCVKWGRFNSASSDFDITRPHKGVVSFCPTHPPPLMYQIRMNIKGDTQHS